MKLEAFLQWLRDLGAERRFLSCYWREPRRRLRLATYLRITPEADWIKCAFIWHDTPEGNRYWHDINRNYQKLLSNNGHNTARRGDIHVSSQSASTPAAPENASTPENAARRGDIHVARQIA